MQRDMSVWSLSLFIHIFPVHSAPILLLAQPVNTHVSADVCIAGY